MSTNNVILLIGGVVFFGGITWFAFAPQSSNIQETDSDQVAVLDTSPKEVISVSHNGSSLVPGEIVLQAGKNYEIQVTPTSNGVGCMFEATVPKISNERWRIEAGKQFTINIPSAKPGRYPVVCTSMGMQQGTIVVQG